LNGLLLLSIIVFEVSVVFHIIALERTKLAERFGERRGKRIGNLIGIASGWLLFASWAGIWFAPQPRFALPIFESIWIKTPIVGIHVPVIHLIAGLCFLVLGAYFGLRAVSKLSLTVSQTQLPNKLVTAGIYAKCRHPQYLGGALAHIGVSLLISAFNSFILTPLVFIGLYSMSQAEEKQLARMFGEQYKEYRDAVPMFVPRIGGELAVSEGQ